MITVYDLCDFFTEPSLQKIELYDLNTEKVFYKGTAEDIPYTTYADLCICSIDSIFNKDGVLTINVEK